MIRRSPAENYFKYLVVHPANYDNHYIRDVADELGLDYLGDWYIENLRARLPKPKPFRPDDLAHGPSYKFLVKEGLLRAFHPDVHYNGAIKIINLPRVRELVETLLLSRAPDDAVKRALERRHQLKVTTDCIRLYGHFFWQIDLLGSMEMRALLEMRHSGVFISAGSESTVSALAQVGALKSMRHSDPRVAAARQPHTPLGSALAQFELGILPKGMDLASLLEQAANLAAVRGAMSLASGGPNGATMSVSFFTAAEIAQRIKASVANPEDKLRSDLKRIALATTANKVPLLSELSGGTHTTNVHPEPKVVSQAVEAEFIDCEEGDE